MPALAYTGYMPHQHTQYPQFGPSQTRLVLGMRMLSFPLSRAEAG